MHMIYALSFPVLTAEMSHAAAHVVQYTILGVTFYIDTVHIFAKLLYSRSNLFFQNLQFAEE